MTNVLEWQKVQERNGTTQNPVRIKYEPHFNLYQPKAQLLKDEKIEHNRAYSSNHYSRLQRTPSNYQQSSCDRIDNDLLMVAPTNTPLITSKHNSPIIHRPRPTINLNKSLLIAAAAQNPIHKQQRFKIEREEDDNLPGTAKSPARKRSKTCNYVRDIKGSDC